MESESRSGQTNNPVEGRYANYFKIGFNAFELIIDFGQCYAEDEEAQLHTRIITNPKYGKELLITLRGSLEEFEATYGCIKD
jgi:Protein of unknown function (DUF3467)